MATKVTEAIAAYRAATTPAAVRRTLAAFKGKDYASLITAEGIRLGALDALRKEIEQEIGR